MASSFLDKNGLLYLWQKIVNKFVAKETGKGLSTNDYTTPEKQKLGSMPGITQIGEGLELTGDGVLNVTESGSAQSVEWENVQNKPQTFPPSAHNHDESYLKLSGGQMTGPIQFSADQGQIALSKETAEAKIEMDTRAAEILFKNKTANKTNRVTMSSTGAEIVVGETSPGDGTGIKVTIDETDGVKIPMVADPVNSRDAVHKDYVDTIAESKANASTVYTKAETYSKTEVYNRTEIDSKISAVYKPGGTVLFSQLPTPSAETLGFVYNMGEAFITDDRFLTPTPIPYPIGTDVAVIAVPGDPITYKFDILAGFVDLSGYLKTTDMVAITNQEIDTVVAS